MSRRAGVRGAVAVAGLGLVIGTVATAARYVPPTAYPGAPDTWGIVTAFTDFGLAGYVLAVLALGTSLVIRFSRARSAVVVLVLAPAILHASWIWPLYLTARPASTVAGSSMTIFSLNMRVGDADVAAVVDATRESDVVVLSEITEPARQRLISLGFGRRFPYERTGTLPADGTAGTTVFSRFPITATEPLPAEIAHQNWLVSLDAPGLGLVRLAAVHPARPTHGRSIWASDHRLLRTALPAPTGPIVLAGDFNAVESHWPMRRLRADGWRSSTDLAGAGWQPTWPVDRLRLPPLLGIDHILLSPALTATDAGRVAIAGSDHLAVTATITAAG